MGFVANYIANLAAVATGRQPLRPLLFSYYITHRCELNCRYCCDGDGKRFKEDPTPELTTDQAKKLISVLRGATDTLDITGGEPMLRPDLEGVLAHARGIGFRTILNTKGIGLETRPDLLGLCDVLVLSLDTLDAAPLAQLIGRPRDTAQEILDALAFAISKAAQNGVSIVLSAVATPDNLEEVSKVLRFAMKNSLGFHVSPEIAGTTVNPALRENDRYKSLVDEVLKAKSAQTGVLGIPQYLIGIHDFTRFRCHPLLMPTIRPDGRMYYPCLESKNAEINLLEYGNYGDALRSVRAREGEIPQCPDCCHIFCHMALSLLQRHPISALAEMKHWRRN